MATFIQEFSNKEILVPLLQRDYIQGLEESVISPFLDALIGKKSIDLNYIYGYNESGRFVPIDGQQRLITLWLFHLYFASLAGELDQYRIKMSFLSREYADDFSKRLLQKIGTAIKETRNGLYKSLDRAIEDQNWFISSWKSSKTIMSMLYTLKYLHQKAMKVDAMELWNELKGEHSHITFSFLEMDEKNGIDDDIYIKMNGRGRALSTFENLKSWMDEQVSYYISKSECEDKQKEQILCIASWQHDMDNKWTSFFWNNRNRNQPHPEEIDDEQLYCFCNLLTLYWVVKSDILSEQIKKMREDDPYLFEELLAYLDIDKTTEQDIDEVRETLMNNINKAKFPPLVWIERLKLMDLEFFEFASKSLNTLSYRYEFLNQCGLFFGDNDSNNETTVYHLSLCEGIYGRTLPLLYAIVILGGEQVADFYDRMRITRNLVLNTGIGFKELKGILSAIQKLSEMIGDGSILDFLGQGKSDKDILGKFDNKQVREEYIKAERKHLYLLPLMQVMENSVFFRGSISCMFDFLKDEEGYDCLNEINFNKYSLILRTIFTGGNKGALCNSLDSSDFLFRRSLVMFGVHYFGIQKSNWSFCDSADDWRMYLTHDKYNSNEPVRELIHTLLVPNLSDDEYKNGLEERIHSILKDYVESVSKNYETDLLRNDIGEKFYLHFAKHPGVWSYMGTKVASWDNSSFRILLKTSNGNRSNKIELRTYCLYLDYTDSTSRKELYDSREGWSCNLYQAGDTSMYFVLNDSRIAVNVWHCKTCEDDYVYELYVRPQNNMTEEEKYNETYTFFTSPRFSNITELFNLSMELSECEHPNIRKAHKGRWLSKKAMSRNCIIEELNRLLPHVRSIIQGNI